MAVDDDCFALNTAHPLPSRPSVPTTTTNCLNMQDGMEAGQLYYKSVHYSFECFCKCPRLSCMSYRIAYPSPVPRIKIVRPSTFHRPPWLPLCVYVWYAPERAFVLCWSFTCAAIINSLPWSSLFLQLQLLLLVLGIAWVDVENCTSPQDPQPPRDSI